MTHPSHSYPPAPCAFLAGLFGLAFLACQGGGAKDDEPVGGSGGTPGTGLPMQTGPVGIPDSETCRPDATPLLKLTSRQYRNTLHDVLRSVGAESAWKAAQDALVTLPPDVHEGYRQLDERVAQNHIDTYYNVARSVADAFASDDTLTRAVAGACAVAATPDADCMRGFVEKLGHQIFRRPVTDAERALYLDAAMTEVTGKDAVAAVAFSLLMSPPFVYHMELGGTLDDGETVVRVDGHALASRLSYLFWDTMPDAALLAAADDGSLLTPAGYSAQVERLFGDPRTRETVWDFYRQWWELEGFPGFASGAVFAAHSAGLDFEKQGESHYQAMVAEIQSMADHFTWETEGSVADVLSTDRAFSTSKILAELYGVEVWDGKGTAPMLPNRAGLITRAATLVTGDHKTGPFDRGAFVRTLLLCDEIPRPDPATLPPGSLEPPAASMSLTTRERFTEKTQASACMACHTHFNDIGYMLESYDSLGRYRTAEKVYDDSGKVIATLPLDVAATPQVTSGDESRLEGPLALVDAVVKSGRTNACFAQQYFRFAFRRLEGNTDGCTLSSIERALSATGGSLEYALRQAAFEPTFQWKGVPKP
jgi:Protein of unknown function (DUF1592)/Protein of unknown function (DUF1588)/Protein of unknown function (DUF1595)